MKPWIKTSIAVSVALAGLTAGSVATLLYTPAGLSMALSATNYFLPSFHVTHANGSVLDGFTLEGFSLDIDGIEVRADSLTLDLRTSCLMKGEICIDTLNSRGFHLTVPNSDTPAEPAPPLTEKIAMPLAIALKSAELSDVHLDIMGTQIAWRTLTTAATMAGTELVLKPTLWDGLAITLPPAEPTDDEKTSSEAANTEPKANATKTPLVLPDVFIPLDVVVEQFDLTDGVLNLPEPQKIGRLSLKGKAGGNQVAVETLAVDVVEGSATLRGDIDLKGHYPMNITLSSQVYVAPVNGQAVDLKASGDLKSLQVYADLSGKLAAQLHGKVNVIDPNFPFDLTFKSPELYWPLDQKPEYFIKENHLKASGSLEGYQVQLKTAASGKDLPDMTLDTALKGSLTHVDVSKLTLHTLGGKISGHALAHWDKEVRWKTTLDFDKIQPGIYQPDFEGEVSGHLQHHGHLTQAGGWQVFLPKLDIDGIIREQSFNLKGDANAWDMTGQGDIGFDTQGLRLSHGKNHVSLKGKYDKKLALDVKLAIESLASSLPDAQGRIHGDINLSGDLKSPVAKVRVSADDLAWQDQVSVGQVSLRGSVQSKKGIHGSVLLDVANIQAAGQKISKVALRASGNEQDQTLSLAVDGAPVDMSLALKGKLKPNESWQGYLHSTQIETPIGAWKLDKRLPIHVALPSGETKLGAFCFNNMKGRICLDQPVTLAESGQAALSIKNFNINTFHPLITEIGTMSGLVNANAKVAWQPNQLPDVDAKVVLSEGMLGEIAGQPLTLGWDQISTQVRLKDDELNAKFGLKLTQNGRLDLNATLTDLSSDDRRLNSRLQINQLQIDFLKSLLEPDAELRGAINADVNLKGALLNPAVHGKLSMSSLGLKSYLVPVILNQGDIDLDFKGAKAKLLGALHTPDGTLALKGHANWEKIKQWAASLNVSGHELQVDVPPMVAMKVSPNLSLNASAKAVNVSGKVDVPWGRITVEALPPSAVQVSSDVVILDDQLKPVVKERKTRLDYKANIAVNIGDDVKLEAFGLSTMLEGLLNVEADPKGPKVVGEVKLEDGTYQSFGQDLLIQKGQILFNGPPTEPYLQIQAIRNPESVQDGVEAGIRVTGSATKPEVTIFSNPSMPQANALSYLMRGTNLDSDTDSSNMTSMLIGLGLSQSGQLVGQIGEAFGVQDLALDTSGTGNEEKLEVSGYILPDLQVKYGVGIFDSLPEFTVRYKLMHNLYVEAVSGLDESLDLLYQFSVK